MIKKQKRNKNTSYLNSQAREEGVKMLGVKNIKKQEYSLSLGQSILVCAFVVRYSSKCDFPID